MKQEKTAQEKSQEKRELIIEPNKERIELIVS